MKNNFILKISFIIIINFFLYLTAFSQTNLTDFSINDTFISNFLTNNFSKERQLISINLLPRHSAIYPTLVNSLVKNIDIFANLAKINIDDIKVYIDSTDIGIKEVLDYVNIKGSFWYIPNISYTFLFNRKIGIELGIGVQSVSYSLKIPKDKIMGLAGKHPDLSKFEGIIGTDTTFKASFVYIPINIGFKFFSGKTHKIVNTLRIGLDTVVYNVETFNGITGIKTKRTTKSPMVYLSYELGWNIDLFPNKNWRVKPYIDFSLFEIGYYIRSINDRIYDDIVEGIGLFGSGLININSTFPSWDTFPNTVNILTSLKIAIFPRFGITIRF